MLHTFFRTAQEGRTPHTPFRRRSRGGECRMPFIGPLKGACPSLCPQKVRRHSFRNIRKGKIIFFFVFMLKYMYMQGRKSQLPNPAGGGGLAGN